MTDLIEGDDELLLNAYLDGELSPSEVLAMERKLATDPALAALLARLTQLRSRITRSLPAMMPPPGLVARVNAATAPRHTRRDWMKMAASVVVAAGVGSGATFLALRPEPGEPVQAAVAVNHIRSLMAAQPTDVSSSDRHTVKPWFSGRIAFAPAVIDLTAQGFPLVGGRIDVIGMTPSPTLVYRHRQHLISLTAIPAAHADHAPRPSRVDGYNLLYWNENGTSYWAVSDLAPSDLEAFAREFRAASKNG